MVHSSWVGFLSENTYTESEKMKGNGDETLMWLLDFKVDTLFNQEESEAARTARRKRSKPVGVRRQPRMATKVQYAPMPPVQLEQPAPMMPQESEPFIDTSDPEHAFTVDLDVIDDVANFEQVECPSNIFEHCQLPSNPGQDGSEFGCPVITFDEQGKPRCTYTDLIERALTDSGGLTVSEIYQWISDNYPFFRPDDDRWKNSVRHNLSINPYFKKGEKARSGAGHLWTISEESRALRPAVRKKDYESQEVSMSIENDTDRAVANILGQYHLAKNNMEGGQHSNKEIVANNSDMNTPNHSQEDNKLLEIPPVVIEYENANFPNTEFTIDLGSFQFPDPNSMNFDDIMPGGLIVIQSDDMDANKENVQLHQNVTNVEDYMIDDYSSLRNESHITETERVSGQLISEALTQDFEMPKQDKCDIMQSNSETQSICQTNQFERLENSASPNSHDYLTLDSIDQIALQEVIHGNNCESHYQMMNATVFEPKDLGYCNFANEVTQ